MATGFGEIVELNSRSFVTDGEEWSFDDRYSIEMEREISDDDKEKEYQYLVIMCGKIMCDFAATFLVSEETPVVNKFNIVLKSSPRTKFTSSLYQMPKNTLLFVCEQLPHLYFANHLLVKVRPFIEKAAHTIVLTSDNMSCYKPRSASQSFLRCLSTKASNLTAQASTLELPNTISGLPAAVLSWCQAKNKSAVVYVLYSESSSLDSITAQPVLQLCRAAQFLDLPQSSSTDKLKIFVNKSQILYSNLYL